MPAVTFRSTDTQLPRVAKLRRDTLLPKTAKSSTLSADEPQVDWETDKPLPSAILLLTEIELPKAIESNTDSPEPATALAIADRVEPILSGLRTDTPDAK